MPRPGRQVELTHPPPPGWADKTPSSPTARVADCGEGNFVIDIPPRAEPFVDDSATHPDPAVRAIAGRHLEGDGESVVVGPEPHLAVGVDVIPDGAGPNQGPDVERERGFDQSAAAGSHGPVLPNRSDSPNHSDCCARDGALGTYEGVLGKYVGQVCAPAPAGSDLAVSLVYPAVKIEEISGASVVQRLAADPFEQPLHQVDRAALGLHRVDRTPSLVAIGARFIRQADDLIPVYGRLAVFAQVGFLPARADPLL